MFNKIRKALVSEKIPAVVCAMACLVSVLMGFTIGYLFVYPSEPLLAYGDTATVYKSGTPHMATVYEFANPPAQYPETVYEEPVLESEDPVASHIYVVTIWGGYIAIYHAQGYGGGLIEVTSTAVGMLAPEELERLAEGIKIYSDEDLARILQDYGS